MNSDKFVFKNGIAAVKLSDWLDCCSNKVKDEDKKPMHIVALPLIQRGSVWKPAKIIDLWDTLLRGMPIGSFMVETIKKDTLLRLPGNKKSTVLQEDAIGLLDGQQRTLAMLAGWPRSPMSGIKLWVDFADTPSTEQLFRLRVTTENNPFGFQRDAPSAKLPIDDRRKSEAIYHGMCGTYTNAERPRLADYAKTFPYAFKPGLPVEINKLISYYEEDCTFSVWKAKVVSELALIKGYHVKKAEGNSDYEALEIETEKMQLLRESDYIMRNLELFHFALTKMMRLAFPLIEIRISDVENNTVGGDGDPPLAILFKRVGSNGEKLSDEDYIFSVIKSSHPETHNFVENLLSPEDGTKRDFNIANLLSPTDIVSTAVRLAAARYRDSQGKPIITDAESFDKNLFNRLGKHKSNNDGAGDFIKNEFLPLIDGSNELGLRPLFDGLSLMIRFDKNNGNSDIGLPAHSLWLLKRPLIQVMLYWLQSVRLDPYVCQLQRENALRFIVFWAVCVHDSANASKVAFELIGNLTTQPSPQPDFQDIYHKIVESKFAYPLFSPNTLFALVPSVIFVDGKINVDKPLVGWRRFELPADAVKMPADAVDEMRNARDFYRRWWGNGHHYHHSLLLWLQRDYVATKIEGSPVAGREEDTPYDFDHILPKSHWYECGKLRGNRILDFMDADGAHNLLGNSIGNVRIWEGSRNRHDSDDSPVLKLGNPADRTYSLIDESHWSYWKNCSAKDGNNKKKWDTPRASSFQLAVENRAFDLYKKLYADLDFSVWVDSAIIGEAPHSPRN